MSLVIRGIRQEFDELEDARQGAAATGGGSSCRRLPLRVSVPVRGRVGTLQSATAHRIHRRSDTVQLPEVRDRPATAGAHEKVEGRHRGPGGASGRFQSGRDAKPTITANQFEEPVRDSEIGLASRVVVSSGDGSPGSRDPHQSTELHDDDVAVCDRLAERQDRALVPRCRTSGAEASPRGDPGRIRSSAGKPSQGARMGMDESSNAMMWRPSFTAWDGISTRRFLPPCSSKALCPTAGQHRHDHHHDHRALHPAGTRQAP